jgi:nucleotide-binding universal stress UspA family protein
MYRKILVPLDGSALAEDVLPQVKGLARLTGAEICLLRIVLVHTLPGVDPTERQVEAVGEAEGYLEEVRARLEKEGFRVCVHVRYGHDAVEILEHAKHEDVDLVAMSTHGRTGLDRWTLGSVSERVVRHSAKPVLLVRVGKGGTS